MRFFHDDLGDKKAKFNRVARTRVFCRDVVQHRNRNRIVGAIVDEPADCRMMIDLIEGDLMAVFGQDRLQQIEVEGDGSTILREAE